MFGVASAAEGITVKCAPAGRAARPDFRGFDAPRATADENGESSLDIIGTEDYDLARVDASVTVGTAIKQLPRRERWILHLRFVEDRTQSEIAKRVGVSQMQVSRLLLRSLRRLRELTGDADSYE